MKKLLIVLLCMCCLCGCVTKPVEEVPEDTLETTAEDEAGEKVRKEFLAELAEAMSSRWNSGDPQAEIDLVEKYKDESFGDEKFRSVVDDYTEALNNHVAYCQVEEMNDESYSNCLEKAVYPRANAIRTFVEDYNFTVEGHEELLDQLIHSQDYVAASDFLYQVSAAAVTDTPITELYNDESDPHGVILSLTNTSDYNFRNVVLMMGSADDKDETVLSNIGGFYYSEPVESWKKGETQEFRFIIDTDNRYIVTTGGYEYNVDFGD